jgi:hypothetical protein
MSHKRIYKMLKQHRHSPVKALEIIVSAKRGDKWALQWIRSVRQCQ